MDADIFIVNFTVRMKPSRAACLKGSSVAEKHPHQSRFLGLICDFAAASLKRTRHHVSGAGNRAPSSIWRATNGCRTPSGRDRFHVPDQDAAPLARLYASQLLARPRRVGADM